MEKTTTAHRLRQIMDERKLKQVDILRAAEPYCSQYKVKLGKNDLSQYVSGKVVPGQEKLTILGLALNVNEAWLMGYDISPGRDSNRNIKPDMSICSPSLQLLDSEEDLLDIFRSLNPAGQDEILKYAKYIQSQPDYKKCDKSTLVPKKA